MRSRSKSEPRGERIDLGGRRLRIVRAGTKDGPLVLLEHGAFGCATDWAEVQDRLAALGVRSLAYDRAGLGFSDPGPEPRDGAALAADLDALLLRLGETGPLVLVGHSMGGLVVQLHALSRHHLLKGMVFVDAVSASITETPAGLRAVRAYGRAMRLVGLGAQIGLMAPVALLMGDLIGLTGQASLEKRRIYGMASHAHWAAREVIQWPGMAELARAQRLPAHIPVAVVTAGPFQGRRWLKALQAAPAAASRHGRVEHVAAATHASLLGRRFAQAIVRGVEHVLAT